MNEPIISPWVFYFINLVANLNFFLPLLALISGVICISAARRIEDCYEKKEKDDYAKLVNIFGVIFLVSTFTALLLPSSDTVYKMLAASYITPANITKVGDTAENAAIKLSDIIVDAAKRLQEDKRK